MSKKRKVQWTELDAQEFERLRLKYDAGPLTSDDEQSTFNCLFQRYGEHLYETDIRFKEAVDITSAGFTAVEQLKSSGIQITKNQREAMVRPFFQEALERFLGKVQ